MFTVTQENRQYATYVLSDTDANSQVEVVPERGGIVTRWSVQDQPIFYLDEERFTHPDLSVRGGNPILFPICGPLPESGYTHGGQLYQMKQHGFGRNLAWQVGDQSTEGAAALTVELSSSAETLAVYPYDFHLAFTYRLQGSTLTVQQKIQNRSAEVMPFSVGFHPYFYVQDKKQLQIEIPATTAYDHLNNTDVPFAGPFDFDQDEIDIALRPVTQPQATVKDPSRGIQLTVTYDDPFKTLVFWTVKGKEFFCLEPWTGPRFSLTSGVDLLSLPAGESLDLQVAYSITSI